MANMGVVNVPTVVRNKNHTDNAQVTTVENNSATRVSNSTRELPPPPLTHGLVSSLRRSGSE